MCKQLRMKLSDIEEPPILCRRYACWAPTHNTCALLPLRVCGTPLKGTAVLTCRAWRLLLLLLPPVCPPVYAALQVVPVNAPSLSAHQAKIAAAADANSTHRRACQYT